jgi:hypothetical protein
VGGAEDVAESGDLAGVVDTFPWDAPAVIFQANIAHAGAADEVVEIGHRAIDVDERVIARVAYDVLGIPNNLAGAVDCVGVAVCTAKCAEVDVIATGTAEERRVKRSIPSNGGVADDLSCVVNAISGAVKSA